MLIPVGEKGKMQTLKVVDRGQDGKVSTPISALEPLSIPARSMQP